MRVSGPKGGEGLREGVCIPSSHRGYSPPLVSQRNSFHGVASSQSVRIMAGVTRLRCCRRQERKARLPWSVRIPARPEHPHGRQG